MDTSFLDQYGDTARVATLAAHWASVEGAPDVDRCKRVLTKLSHGTKYVATAAVREYIDGPAKKSKKKAAKKAEE